MGADDESAPIHTLRICTLINENDLAPDFSLESDDHKIITLASLKGKTVVLYFYPKDNTTGCTKEACDFRDAFPNFSSTNATILGVSRDSLKSHKNFKDKYNLTFPLLSDEDGAVCQAYGVWVEKSMYGRKYFGIERSTFLIDSKGIIRKIWRKVKVPGHTQEVLEAVKGL